MHKKSCSPLPIKYYLDDQIKADEMDGVIYRVCVCAETRNAYGVAVGKPGKK
jgi:hypothetical protein